ncbi:hypothetical protein U9M48_041372, partial [Paspalum notatum var. saurae]
KLAPRYIGPYQIVKKCSAVAYRFQLPKNLARVHNVFHVSELKKCLKPPIDVVITDIRQLEEDLSYPEYPVRILDQKDRVTRKQTITFCKVQWRNENEEAIQEETVANVNYTEATNFDHSQSKPRRYLSGFTMLRAAALQELLSNRELQPQPW